MFGIFQLRESWNPCFSTSFNDWEMVREEISSMFAGLNSV